MDKAPITTHILDLQLGKPAAGVKVELYAPDQSEAVATSTTDEDGRIILWPENFELSPGKWTLRFQVEEWFESQKRETFFADVSLSFKVKETSEHYHVPLLLNAFGYSTYRGS